MKLLKYLNVGLCVGALALSGVSSGCAGKADGEAGAPAPRPLAAARPAAPSAAEAADSAHVTRVSYKTGVAPDKVKTILDLYRRFSAPDNSGQDLRDIAVLGSEKTGLTVSEVSSVILDYKALFESGAAPQPELAIVAP